MTVHSNSFSHHASRKAVKGSIASPRDRFALSSSCLINNHNYGRFVCDAVDSALEQTLPYDEIIVVDDGSTDDSLTRLKGRFGQIPNVKIVSKPQGGQLSCIQRGIDIASGELLFLLDSDDCQQPELHAEVQAVFRTRPSVDFVTVDNEVFGPCAGKPRKKQRSRDLGVSALAAIFFRRWVGAPTSCLSMRSSLISKILPYPDESAWKTRADDIFVMGSSIVGAHKYHLAKQLIRYRLHGENHYNGKSWSRVEKMQYALELNRLIECYVARSGFNQSLLPKLVAKEFRTIEKPVAKDLLLYLRLCGHSCMTWDVRLGNALSVLKHYVCERYRITRPVDENASDPSLPLVSAEAECETRSRAA